MKKIFIGLICTAIFASCSSGDSSNNSTAGSGSGGGALDLNTPKTSRKYPDQANAIIDWELSLMGRSDFIKFYGHTANNLPCTLALTDLRKGGPIETNHFYLSLGTGATPQTNEDQYTWIGTFIAPQYSYHELKKTSTEIHFSDTNEGFTSPEYTVPKHLNDLVVVIDSKGHPVKAIGQSSHWPGSTCILQ